MTRLHLLFFSSACLLLAHTTVLARVDKELLQTYKVAKQYYAASDYAAAKAALVPLINAEIKNDITPYALFYYALATYSQGESSLAESTFTTIVEEYPAWEQQDEVWYWLGQLRFEEKDYGAGLDRLARITDKTLAAPSEQMKVYFLRQLDDIFLLQTLFSQYPKDQEVARVLFDKIAHQPLISRDLDLLNVLACNFNFSLEEQHPLKETIPLKKDKYNVGVFFPFFVDEVDYEEESSNSFVIALYQGIKAAVAALIDQGIEINLFAYDTKKDPVTTAALLEQEEVKGMDLIIGPLYAATIPLVAEFARAHQINLFNPLSENTDVVGDNPFVFLFKSSLETQARKAAEFTLQNSNQEINVGIVYGTSKADAMQAHTYKRCIEHNTGKEVALMLSITPEEVQNSLNVLREAEEGVGAEQATKNKELISLDGLTHLYVAAKDELTVANVLSTVTMLKASPCIIGHEEWLRHSSFTFDQLKQHRLYLVAPDYIDYTKAGIHEFRSSFYDRFAQYPTTYACIGYDMMLFLGHMLARYGVYFQQHWTKESHPRSIFESAAYGIHHDNQQVPIVQFRKDRFVICNRGMPID
jgi:Periplasmic binding protein